MIDAENWSRANFFEQRAIEFEGHKVAQVGCLPYNEDKANVEKLRRAVGLRSLTELRVRSSRDVWLAQTVKPNLPAPSEVPATILRE